MALTPDDKTRLYSDAFGRNAKAMLGESAFAALDLMTTRDVLNMELGVTRDELQAAQESLTAAEDAHTALRALYDNTTEGKDAALQALADAAPIPVAEPVPRRRR